MVGGAGPRMLHSNHTYDLEKFTKKHASSLFIVLLQANFYSFYMPICYYKQFVMGSELNMHGPYYLHILAIHIKHYSLITTTRSSYIYSQVTWTRLLCT